MLVRLASIGVLFFLSALFAPRAAADAIEPPPMDCARGLRPESSHGGPFCALDVCGAGGVCAGGRSCVPRSFCVASRTGYAIDGAFVDETATFACTTDADCGGGGTCRMVDVCVDVAGHRLRGLVLLSFGLFAFGVVAVLAVLSMRGRRRR